MNSTNNRQNHDFQITYFIIGACHTPDAAWSMLSDCLESRDNAIKLAESSMLRESAKRIRAEHVIACNMDLADVLEAKADIMEIEAMSLTVEKNLAAAKAERAFIEKCMDCLQPLRKYKDLPPAEAHEAVQREEWKLELITRGENYILMHGNIPAEHFGTMRLHPDFIEINQHLDKVHSLQIKAKSGDSNSANKLNDLIFKSNFKLPDLPLLLTN